METREVQSEIRKYSRIRVTPPWGCGVPSLKTVRSHLGVGLGSLRQKALPKQGLGFLRPFLISSILGYFSWLQDLLTQLRTDVILCWVSLNSYFWESRSSTAYLRASLPLCGNSGWRQGASWSSCYSLIAINLHTLMLSFSNQNCWFHFLSILFR